MPKWNSLLPARSALEHDGGDSSAVWWHKLPSSVGRGDTTIAAIATDSTGLYQMLGISCLGLRPAALLETHCVGLQVLISCQKKDLRKMVRKRHGNKFWDTLTPHSAATMFLALRQWQSSQKGRTAHYACWADWAARMSFCRQLMVGKVTLRRDKDCTFGANL